MRHGMKGRKLGRTSSHRLALFRNQLASFVEHERIITTLPKAKELRPLAEKMVTLGRKSTLHARRQVLRWIPSADAVRKLFDDISPRFAERNGGYTRIVKLGPRPGDGAEMAVLEFVDYVLTPKAEPGEERKPKASLLDRAKAAVTRRPKTEKAEETAASGEEGEKKPTAKAKSKPKPVAAKAKSAKPKPKPKAAAKTAKPKREAKSEAKGSGQKTGGAAKGKSSAGGNRKTGRASSGGKKGSGR